VAGRLWSWAAMQGGELSRGGPIVAGEAVVVPPSSATVAPPRGPSRASSCPAHASEEPELELTTREGRGSPWETSCAWLAFLVPATAGVWLAEAQPLWRSDAAQLDLLGAPPALQGVVSSLLSHGAQLVPLGGALSRAATVGGIALGVAGVMLHRLYLSLLRANGAAPRLNPAMALCAAVAAVLGLPWLTEGTVSGGQAVAGALAFATLGCAVNPLHVGRGRHAAPRTLQREAPRKVLLGALLGATLLENLGAGVAILAALGVLLWQAGRVPSRREGLLVALGLGVVLCARLAPVLLAPALVPVQGLAAERVASLQSGLGLDRLGLGELAPGLDPEVWLQEVGLLLLAAGLLGALWGLGQRRLRLLLAPLLTLVLLDVLVGGAGGEPGSAPTPAGVHLLAIGGALGAAALGLHTVALLALRARLAGARPAVALLVVMTLAVTWAGAEDALRLVARRNVEATERWTDELLMSLPPRSLVVVQSPPLVRRLGAAVASGARADVVVVPLPLLGRGQLAAELLELEPALGLLVRDLSTAGRPSERALTALADARPLFVEADATWDRRLMVHLIPGPFLARFAPHPLGRSDRRVAFASQQGTFERVAEAALGPLAPDPATLAVLTRSGLQRRALLEALGDEQEAAAVGEQVDRLQGASPAPSRVAQLTSTPAR